MIKVTLKYIGITIIIYVFICLITPYFNFLKHRSIENQICWLSEIMDNGYDDTLQSKFPEGKLFSNSILALSTIQYCDKNKIYDFKYSAIVDSCISRIQSKRTRRIFNSDMSPKYGIFYNGWSNLVYSKYKKSQLFKYSNLKSSIKDVSKKIEERIYQTQTDSLRILDTYIGSNWPADNLIGISSINNDSLKQIWIEKLFEETRHDSGLIHHAGSNERVIRGSSSAMMTYCLGLSDYSNIGKYNDLFHSIFIDEYLGVQLVKENEDASNSMDIDSGPVIFGYGASATIMNIKTQASLGNKKSKLTWAVMNTLGLSMNLFNKKYYLFKQEPMFDLFMLWGSTEL